MNMFEKLMAESGLTARPEQSKLVSLALGAMEAGEVAFVQAGTGVGKSFALLTMALQSAKANNMPSVVVTPTLSLMNQYRSKDIPFVQQALGGEFMLVKGRSNYLCEQSAAGRKLKKSEAHSQLQGLFDSGLLEWAQAGLTYEWGCTGDCDPKYGELCGVQKMRELAAAADVIITTGATLVWDRKVDLMTAGVARLLPAYGALFVDECHELDAVAKSCNSDQIGQNSSVYDAIVGLNQWAHKQLDKLGRFQTEAPVTPDEELVKMLADATNQAGRLESQIAGTVGNEGSGEELKELRSELKAYQRFIDFATSEDDRFISTITKEQNKAGEDVAMLNLKCVDSSSWTRPILTGQASVLVSGTIPPSLPARLGVKGSTLSDVGTPFDYSESVLAISAFSAKEQSNDWKRVKETCGAVVDMARRPHEEGGGGSLLLFTSWKDLDAVMPQVQKALADAGVEVPVYQQSRDDQAQTATDLEQFKAHGHAVMGGVQSLWTGVDIPGAALRQVIVFRLPWAVPSLEVKAVEARFGRQPYIDDMTTRLVQGIGRLVRRAGDNGRVFIVDSRAKQQRWRSNTMSKHVAQFAPHKR